MRLEEATEIVKAISERIEPHCVKFFVGGSIARMKPEVKDVDLVLQPITHITRNMFQDPVGEWSEVDEALGIMWQEGIFEYLMDGPKHKKLGLANHDLVIELWIVTPPAQWGVIKAIRTGPADFSHQFVTPRNQMTKPLKDGKPYPGLLPSWAKVSEGVVWVNNQPVEMPEEEDFFRFLELEWIPPQDRKAAFPRNLKRITP